MDNKILIHSANSPDVYHWGIHGQQWGKRRYQNEDGSLTPLGRIHYGVGEAKERSKIKIREMKAETKSAVKLAKAQAKAAKAVANAEKEKIAAKTKEYRDRKEADNIVELEKIKAQREADRMDAKNEAQLNKSLAEATKENAEAERGSSRAVKTVLGIMAAAGIGYLIYKAASHGKTSASTREAAEEAIKKVSDKPVSEVVKKSNDITKAVVSDTVSKGGGIKGQPWGVNAVTKSGAKTWKNNLKRESNYNIDDVIKTKSFGLTKKTERFTPTKIDTSKLSKNIPYQYSKNPVKKLVEWGTGSKQQYNEIISRGFTPQEAFKMIGQKIPKYLRHSDNGMILIHSAKNVPNGYMLVHSEDVCHWGILGMKWGVRRYQNPDGTLTELGKQHYGKKDTTKFMKAKNYASKYKIANESEIVKYFKKNSDEYADLNKHYNELKSLGENVTEQQAKDFQEVTRGVRQAAAEFIEKYSDKPANLMAIYAWDDENRRAYEITKQSRIKIEREAMENLKKEDLFDEQRVKEDPKRANEAAITGLKALNKIGRDGYDENEGITKGDKEWFIWEDQTIGLATIADLVNQGKSSSEIKAIVKAANSITDDETTSSQSGVWQLANSGYSWRPEAIDGFIDACIEVKKEDSKIKHSDYDGGNSLCLTKLF